MTSPFYPDPNPTTGPHSSQGEWASFLARRQELLNLILHSTMQPSVAEGPQQIAMNDRQETMVHQPQPPLPQRPHTMREDELIGQAKFWGIPNPEAMSADDLYAMI